MPTAWLSSPYLTHMFNSPSVFLPHIEGLVNGAILKSIPHINHPTLKNECLIFVTQEAFHSREHVKYNQQLKALGYEADSILHEIKSKLSNIRKKWSLLSLLALGSSFECLTTKVSLTVTEDNILVSAYPMMSDFWNWHMKEEIEHKAVLFDVYRHLGGRYWRRAGIHTLVLFYYCYYSLRIYLRFLKKDQRSLLKGMLFVTNRKSFFRKSLFRSISFYQASYHPNVEN